MEVRTRQGLYHPPKAGSGSVEAKALAELKAVTIALADQAINESLRNRSCSGSERRGSDAAGATEREHSGSRASGRLLRQEQPSGGRNLTRSFHLVVSHEFECVILQRARRWRRMEQIGRN